PAGIPPTTPGSAVSVSSSIIFSSLATFATPSGHPMPRFTMSLALSSRADRRAMIFRSHGDADLATECRIVRCPKGLPMMLWLGNHDAIHQDSRHFDLPGIQCSTFGNPLDLRDDDPSGI